MNLHEIYLAAQLAKNDSNGNDVDLSDYYTKSQTDGLISEKVAEIVADAPEDFDTLKEMSDWIVGHEDSAAAMNSAIAANSAAIAQKVDKVTGKGLSTNDFMDADKSKLDSLENYDDAEIKAEITNTTEQTAFNRGTLGYQRKNLIENNGKTTTVSGITFTKNADGSVTVNGTSTSTTATFSLTPAPFPACNSIFPSKIKLVATGTSENLKFGVQISNSPSTGYFIGFYDTGQGVVVDMSNYPDKYAFFHLNVPNGKTVSNVTVYPMVVDAEVEDTAYVPYKPSVAEYIASLEERIAALESMNLTANSPNSSLTTVEINAKEEEIL